MAGAATEGESRERSGGISTGRAAALKDVLGTRKDSQLRAADSSDRA